MRDSRKPVFPSREYLTGSSLFDLTAGTQSGRWQVDPAKYIMTGMCDCKLMDMINFVKSEREVLVYV